MYVTPYLECHEGRPTRKAHPARLREWLRPHAAEVTFYQGLRWIPAWETMRIADVPYSQADIRMLDKYPADHITDLPCLQLIDRGGSTFRNPCQVVADLRPNE